MDERKELILNTIIQEYVKFGMPVSSGHLVEKYKLGVSPATVRNDMGVLEDDGYIVQPHTSAGRIPTEKAFDFFLSRMKEKKLKSSEIEILEEAMGAKDEQAFKKTAKAMAQISGQAVVWAFHRHNIYYTGISNFLSQPEFERSNHLYDISYLIDQIDEIMADLFDRIGAGTEVMIGSKNPFSPLCGSVMAKYKLDGQTGMVGILGPLRMDYQKNLCVINTVKELIGS